MRSFVCQNHQCRKSHFKAFFRFSETSVQKIEFFVETFFLENEISNNFYFKFFSVKVILFKIFKIIARITLFFRFPGKAGRKIRLVNPTSFVKFDCQQLLLQTFLEKTDIFRDIGRNL